MSEYAAVVEVTFEAETRDQAEAVVDEIQVRLSETLPTFRDVQTLGLEEL